jgi:prenylcysteine oxidase / farnesylcysteine lyase
MSMFLKISNGFSSNFGTVNSLLDAVGLSYAVGDKASELLKLKGISETYVREVISPEVRRRFGQNIEELSELAISLALDRSDQGDAYVGGRITQVLEDLMDQSAADFRFNTVAREFRHELMENGDMKWILEHRNQSSEALEYSMFDKVILSAPWNPASMAIESEEIGIRKASGYHEEVEYRTRHITFFTSPFGLSEDYFGTKSLPPTILLIPSKNEESLVDEISFVRELSRMVGDATVTEKLYRILSSRKVDDQTIRSLVGGDSEGVTWLHRDIVSRLFIPK